MQEFLTKQTVQDLGIPSTRHLWIDAQELWQELDKGNIRSDVIGESLTRAAIITINRQFKEQQESYLEQDLMVSEVVAQLYEKLIVDGALYSAFPSLDEGKRERQFIAYILKVAFRELINIIVGKVGKKTDPQDPKIGRKKTGSQDLKVESNETESKDSSWRRKRFAFPQSIDEIKDKRRKEGKSDYDLGEDLIENHLLPQDPAERHFIEEHFREVLQDTYNKQKRIKAKVETLLGKMGKRVVVVDNQVKIVAFENPVHFLQSVSDYEVLDNYLFYSIHPDTKVEKKYFPEEEKDGIERINRSLDLIK